MPRTHELKILPDYFLDVINGLKTFEIRLDDRGFEVNDLLRIREWQPCPPGGYYTGRETLVRVTYILPGFRLHGAFVAMAIVPCGEAGL